MVKKSTNLLLKKSYLIYQYFYNFFNKFLALWECKMNVLDSFDVNDFFKIFFVSRSIEILIKSNFCLGTSHMSLRGG